MCGAGRAVFALFEVLRRLSSPSRAAVAPFSACKLTRCLAELLGGNAIVLARHPDIPILSYPILSYAIYCAIPNLT